MDAVSDLLAVEQIKNLKARYFRLLDTKQWAQWREVITDDLQAFYDPVVGGPTRRLADGADAFVDALAADMAESVTGHHGHTPEIEISGSDTATGIWAMSDIVQHPAHHPRPSVMGTGHYHEEYRRGTDERWRIARFHLKRLTLSSVDLTPASVWQPEQASQLRVWRH